MLTLLIGEKEVEELLTYELALRSLEEAFSSLEEGVAVNTQRSRTSLGVFSLSVQPGALRNFTGVKVYLSGKYPTNFVSLLFDGNTGELLSITESDRMGQVRTGSLSVMASKYMSNSMGTVGIVGAGKQGRAQVEAYGTLTKSRILLFSRTPSKSEAVKAQMKSKGIEVEVVQSVREVCKADVVTTITNSKDPFLKRDYLGDEMHINLMGSNLQTRAEAFPEVIKDASIIAVEDLQQAKSESGDFILAEKMGMIDYSKVVNLSKFVSGKVKRKGLTIFKSVGIGLEDVAVLKVIYEEAKRKGLGSEIKVRGSWSQG